MRVIEVIAEKITSGGVKNGLRVGLHDESRS